MMSQQHTSQTSGQGLLERVFKLREHGTTARTEVIAGFTTFLTMVYIVFVNPQILGVAGMDTSAVFVTTCLIAARQHSDGVFANLPVALAPAMGLNASSPSWWFRRWGCRGRWGWALSSGARLACCC
jgi:AGZA family xanthine/uracil permease-like MFS transporter